MFLNARTQRLDISGKLHMSFMSSLNFLYEKYFQCRVCEVSKAVMLAVLDVFLIV